MRRSSHWVTNDEGSAALEFITVGVILLVPVIYLVIALGAIQEQTFGAEAAARHTARAMAMAPDAATGARRSEAVLAGVVDEYGLDPDAVDVSLSCTPIGVACPSAGATLTVTVSTRVRLPLVPPLLGLDRVTAIGVEAASAQRVSRQWGEK